MELILWRHAQAQNGYPDEARQLTDYGLNQAQKMSAWLNMKLPQETRIIASPAERTQQTVKTLGRSFETCHEIAVGASTNDILSAAGWPDAQGAVLVVGHQPTLGEVAYSLLQDNMPATFEFKPATVVWLRSQGDPLATNHQCKLQTVKYPEDL